MRSTISRSSLQTIEAMAAQGRPPTDAEWSIMRARSDDAHARLQAVKEELLEEEEPEETVDDEEPTEPEEPVTDPTPAVETLPD